jgi:type II secretory pathway component PulM
MQISLVKKLVYIILIAIVIFLTIVLFRALVPEPPFQEIEQARQAIAVARDHNSLIYSPKIFREARSYYDSAMVA